MTSVRLNPANSRIYACCLDKSIKVFGLKSQTMLKELTGGHSSYIMGFDFLRVRSETNVVKTDDLVLSYGFDGRVILWAIGPNARLFSSAYLQAQEFLPPVSIVLNMPMETMLKQ